ncbi:3264_t:CDS:2 [Diversispora eburnea]|uniref:3264_t:CDS:1 n=1 Tax=Diversispora eburnea TaxID=1213867 RepID=A0A9N9C8M2_9GLOM|nr:3264_t:CDS:2 [Diversispora eburnea]
MSHWIIYGQSVKIHTDIHRDVPYNKRRHRKITYLRLKKFPGSTYCPSSASFLKFTLVFLKKEIYIAIYPLKIGLGWNGIGSSEMNTGIDRLDLSFSSSIWSAYVQFLIQ